MNTYIAIDLKSFYASVECIERALNPLTTNLVVANTERTEKTICLAVSPSLKSYGISGRARLYEVIQSVKRINAKRKYFAQKHIFTGSSCDNLELKNNPSLELSYIIAKPRMAFYINYSTRIYEVYLKYVSPQDIHVYSIDEVFIDATSYLKLYNLSAHEFAMKIILDILKTTGITATAGIGTNLYLAKVALDITAKHVEDHIGILDEESYCKTLWNHKPLTDFWRMGKGIANRLEQSGIRTIGEIAHADEDMLYRMFGVDAELLIDHAWGRESTTMQDIKSYRPKTNSLSSGQVLECDYTFEKGKLVVKEMADLLCLELVEKGLVTDSITLHVGYSNRLEKKPAHGTIGLRNSTSSARQIIAATEKLYCQIVDPYTSVRRMTVTFNQVVDEQYQQYDLFTDPAELEREHRMQEAILDIKEKFGKNAILRGMDLQTGATTMERNRQIGGHKSGT